MSFVCAHVCVCVSARAEVFVLGKGVDDDKGCLLQALHVCVWGGGGGVNVYAYVRAWSSAPLHRRILRIKWSNKVNCFKERPWKP